MYSQHPHHPLRPQSQQTQQVPHYPAVIDTSYNPSITAYNTGNNTIVRHSQLPPPPPPHHQGFALVVPPPEPAPNASDSNTPPLSIPELADFASIMVYLMWHARRPSVMALHDLSKAISNTQQTTSDHQLGHSKETATIANRTSAAFKKFCKQVLTATQLSESVILLALKYIAMLLQYNPSIQGAEGSEYRLFTVALMLGNKFLDDNTFTNKTWSEVTGMKVTDLNIMELEFLDVLRFRLFVRKDEFERWKSVVLLFRSQLLNADEAQKQQQLIEETFKGIVSIQQQQQQQQQNQQQYQLMLMLSKAQLPHFPTQPLNRPLTRVPLRIPLQPVWRHHHPIPNTNTSQNTSDYYHYPTSAAPTPSLTTTSSVSNNMPYHPHHPHHQQPQTQHQQQTMRPMNAYSNGYYASAPTPTSIDSYYSNGSRQQQPPPQQQQQQQQPIRPSRTSYYTEPMSDYTPPADIYSRPVTTPVSANHNPGYQQPQQQPQQPVYNGNNGRQSYRRPNGPVPEDPMTAIESYHNHLK
ncbi:hypothetical protein BCV72DRAFT_283743 [Rhizopus microsporus var. microsporus]|uniref:Cyclin-domain-containing protein n=1 Tax=Rhizopus microsporus var. microsporus TaxID=86635 RepID=A0A1X0RIN1_RHIZD|nr:hypothetical protein BCV72DRAFT_283743 [Rhizopus microsporus var. microsporus]